MKLYIGRNSGPGRLFHQSVSAVIIGYSGDVSREKKRGNLLEYAEETRITDDNGDSVTEHCDYSEIFYRDVIQLLTAPGDWILIPHLTSGKGHRHMQVPT